MIARLSKMDMFLPKNVHHLKIQLETVMLMLEELTVRDGCRVKSLRAAWRFVRQNSAHIARLIAVDKMLAVKIVYQLDTKLQKQFSVVANNEAPMIDKVCSRSTPSVVVRP
jgi:hypothetical protein